jgi:hypothetical protein
LRYKSGFIFTINLLLPLALLRQVIIISPETSDEIFNFRLNFTVAETVSTIVVAFTTAVSTSLPSSLFPTAF